MPIKRTCATILLCAAALFPRAQATAAELELRDGSDLVGGVRQYTAVHEDTLEAIARKFGMGFVELMSANPGVNPSLTITAMAERAMSLIPAKGEPEAR